MMMMKSGALTKSFDNIKKTVYPVLYRFEAGTQCINAKINAEALRQ